MIGRLFDVAEAPGVFLFAANSYVLRERAIDSAFIQQTDRHSNNFCMRRSGTTFLS